MPRLDENTQQYLRDAEQGVRARTVGAWDSFTNFALRDNVLEVAVGLMYASVDLISVFTLTTLQTSRLLHSMRQLPRNRHHSSPHFPPPLPLAEPRREVRHHETRAQLQHVHLDGLQHQGSGA
jgi:hypothetical protein